MKCVRKEVNKVKIAILGASGRVGKRIVDEALMRGHEVVGMGGQTTSRIK